MPERDVYGFPLAYNARAAPKAPEKCPVSHSSFLAAFHARAFPGVIAVTGGGAGALAALASVPGASQTLLEAIVPYSPEALIRFLGDVPVQFCSAETAAKMAERAYIRAGQLAPTRPVWGAAATAALVSAVPKKGDHRVFVAVRTAESLLEISLVLKKGARDRAGEEAVVSTILLNALAEASGLADRLPLELFDSEHPIVTRREFAGPTGWFLREIDGSERSGGAPPRLVFPGSFRPLHAGHRQLAAVAAARLGLPVTFEISRTNVDKPPLDEADLARRLAQFAWYAPVAVTPAPTFLEKARLFPGAHFLLGADTALRLLDPKYHGNDEMQRDADLDELRRLGCSFLVAGRTDATGQFIDPNRIGIPERFTGLFTALEEGEFRLDISSTMLRK